MILTLVISDNCAACDRAKKVIEQFQNIHPHIATETIHINSYKGKGITITPALLVDQKLFSYGDIDETSLYKKIN